MATAASITAWALVTAAADLVAIGLGLLQLLLAGVILRGEEFAAAEFKLHFLGGGLRRHHLGLGLIDAGALGDDLAADAIDGGLLGRDLVARRVGREPVVAVVDGGDDVAGPHRGIVLDRDAGDIAGDLGSERGVVSAHIGVVGRHQIAAGQPPMHTISATGPERRDDSADDQCPLVEGAPKRNARPN